jgi:hypothetical protein
MPAAAHQVTLVHHPLPVVPQHARAVSPAPRCGRGVCAGSSPPSARHAPALHQCRPTDQAGKSTVVLDPGGATKDPCEEVSIARRSSGKDTCTYGTFGGAVAARSCGVAPSSGTALHETDRIWS